MLSSITIGQYYPGSSLLHRLDPRVKLLLLLAFMAEIFVFGSASAYAVFSAVTLMLMLSSGVPLKILLGSLRPLWWVIVFTFLIHLCSTPGVPFARIWIFSLTYEGLTHGGLICLRLALLILMSSLLTFTTSPLKLTDALEALLRPFKRFGMPAHELAMMMTIALRFVPTLIEETDRIMKAQQSRGVDFSEGNLLKRAQNMVPILVPLFLSAFRRADDLALAMEARCYRGGEGRTQMKALRVSQIDFVAVGAFLLLTAVLSALCIFY